MQESRYFSFLARDAVAAVALIVWNALAIIGSAITLHRAWPQLSDPVVVVRTAATLLFIVLMGTQIVVLCIRRPPVAKAPGCLPRIFAIIGAHLTTLILLLPLGTPNRTIEVASAVMMAIGALGATYTISHLNRSFSIFPQARALVTTGPYNLIRHPLYISEELIVLGLSLTYVRPWGVLFAAASFLAQLPRIYFEEKVLIATFPAYASYAKKIPALIPFMFL